MPASVLPSLSLSWLKYMPECYNQFVEICNILEKHYHDMQDMEFTIEDRKLYMLQTRNGKTYRYRRAEDRRATWLTRA